MENDRVGPGRDKAIDEFPRVFDHQMHFERLRRDRTEPLADDRTHAQIGHEMAIHHVDMNAVGSGLGRLANEFTQSGKVGGQNGRSDHGRSRYGDR